MGATRMMAFDWGERRVGLALSDELGLYAHPRGTLPPEPEARFFEQICAVCSEEGVQALVVGLPLDMHGGEGRTAKRVRAFAQKLADATGLDVELFDERWSSKQAERSLASSGLDAKRAKQRVDEAAAVAILQAVLDRRQRA